MGREERFSHIRRRLQASGWTLARIRGSHHVFDKPNESPLSIPVHRGKVKAVYVNEVKKRIQKESGE